jgi:hypothetical protein
VGSGLPEQVELRVALGERLQVTFVVVRTLPRQRLEAQREWERVRWSIDSQNAEVCLVADVDNTGVWEVDGKVPAHAREMDVAQKKRQEFVRPSCCHVETAVDGEVEPSWPGLEAQTLGVSRETKVD